MICENCLYNKNCQFLLKHKNEEAEKALKDMRKDSNGGKTND